MPDVFEKSCAGSTVGPGIRGLAPGGAPAAGHRRAPSHGRGRAQPRRARRLRRPEHPRPAHDEAESALARAGEHSAAASSRLAEGEPAHVLCGKIGRAGRLPSPSEAMATAGLPASCSATQLRPCSTKPPARCCSRGGRPRFPEFPSSIIVGVDGSPISVRALDAARSSVTASGFRCAPSWRQAASRSTSRAFAASASSSGTSGSRSKRSSPLPARRTCSSSEAEAFTALALSEASVSGWPTGQRARSSSSGRHNSQRRRTTGLSAFS